VIVRFARAPGPPPQDEAEWYDRWLDTVPGRKLVYIPRDYDATKEYWTLALRQLPENAPTRQRERVQEALDAAGNWVSRLSSPAAKPAAADSWFAVKKGPAVVCKKLDGPWAKGLDPASVALTRHETLKTDGERVLLSGDDEPLVITWTRANDGGVLVAAGGPFLLNLPLTVSARRPLAERVVNWAEGSSDHEDEEGEAGSKRPSASLRVAFLEGEDVVSGPVKSPSPFELLSVPPFGRVAAQLFLLALAACLAYAPRLGRPRPEEPPGTDRPAAHAEALAALLARTGQAREARSILDAYRRWRTGPTSPSRGRHPSPPML
jgi:hypothetical protein